MSCTDSIGLLVEKERTAARGARDLFEFEVDS